MVQTNNQNIDNINNLVQKAVKEIKIANSRAASAEKMLEIVKLSLKEEIQKAYKQGYIAGKNENNSNDGGTQKTNEGTKLVLKSN